MTRSSSRNLLIALTAALVLATALDTASARRLELSSPDISVVWPTLTLSNTSTGMGSVAACKLTLEGTFHSRTLSKVSGQLIGFITRAKQNVCAVGGGLEAGEILVTKLPWHLRYDSFRGTLPSITGVRFQIIEMGIAVLIMLNVCLYRSVAEKPAFAIANFDAAGESTGIRFDETREIQLASGIFVCPQQFFIIGTSMPIVVLTIGRTIRIRLVA